jgi:hypothetical protein
MYESQGQLYAGSHPAESINGLQLGEVGLAMTGGQFSGVKTHGRKLTTALGVGNQLGHAGLLS